MSSVAERFLDEVFSADVDAEELLVMYLGRYCESRDIGYDSCRYDFIDGSVLVHSGEYFDTGYADTDCHCMSGAGMHHEECEYA